MNSPYQKPVPRAKQFISSVFDLAFGAHDGSEPLSSAEVKVYLRESGIEPDAVWNSAAGLFSDPVIKLSLVEARKERLATPAPSRSCSAPKTRKVLMDHINEFLSGLRPNTGAVFARKWEESAIEDLTAIHEQLIRQIERSKHDEQPVSSINSPNNDPRQLVAEARALKLLDAYGLIRPSDIILEDLAYALGIEVLFRPLAGADAHLVRVGKKGGITINDSIVERGRRRFAIAHEIGHWELHEGRTQVFLCTADDMRDYKASVEEIEANIFASELLMPMRMMSPGIKSKEPSIAVIEEIASRFDVSLTAAALRYVTKFDFPLMIVFSSAGKVTWWRRNEENMAFLFLESAQPLAETSRAAAIMAGEPNDTEPVEVPWEAWFPGIASQGTLREQAKKFDNYDIVMSLIRLEPE